MALDWTKNEKMVLTRMVRGAVEAIRVVAKVDDEAAHVMEDELHREVLKAIADHRVYDASTVAVEALKTQEIEFARSCA